MTDRLRLRLLPALLLLSLAVPARAEVRLDEGRCRALASSWSELRRLTTVEVGARGGALRVDVTCKGLVARVRLLGGRGSQVEKRTIDLRDASAAARPRLLALAIAELVSTRAEASAVPAPPTRKKTNMLKRVLAGGAIWVQLLGAALADPGGQGSKRELPLPPPSPTAPAVTAPRVAAVVARPTVTYTDVLGAGGDKLRDVTERQIRVMQNLLAVTAEGDAERADLHFRLAELHADQQRWFDFHARALDQKIFDARQRHDGAAERRLGAEQTELQRRERQALLDAVRQYLEVADQRDRYPDYARTDELLYRLAYMLKQAGKADASRTYLSRLLKDHPRSPYVGDAYLAFAEHFFDERAMNEALTFYDKVLALPGSRLAGYARYKQGWCWLNLQDYRRALATFVDVVEQARRTAGRPGGDKLPLLREARKDLVRAYAHAGVADRAWVFFQRVGGEAAPAMLEQLAELYQSQGKPTQAVLLYHQLMAATPASPRLCLWQAEVVKSTLAATGAKADAATLRELERLAALHDRTREGRGLKADLVAECRADTATLLRELATTWHREAQKTGAVATYELAGQVYPLYLARFGGERDAYAMAFYRGELLYKLGSFDGGLAGSRALRSTGDQTSSGHTPRFCDAARAYQEVVERDTAPDAKYLREAAGAAVIAWRDCLQIDDANVETAAARREGTTESLAARPIPEPWRRMLVALDGYIAHVPDGADLVKVKYQKGRILYEFNHFAEAIPLFRAVAEAHAFEASGLELAIYAVNLLFDCLALLHQQTELAAAVEHFCPRSDLAVNPEFKRRCDVIDASLLRARAEALGTQQRHREAAELYVRLAARYPEYPELDEVYFNAHEHYLKVKLVGLAVQQLQRLIEHRPDSKLARRAPFLLGRAYQNLAAYDAAAESYERYARTVPGEPDAPMALITASFFRRGLGQSDKALEDDDLYVKTYGPRGELADRVDLVEWSKHQVYEQRKDPAGVERQLRRYLSAYGKAIDRVVIAHVKLADVAWREACPVAAVEGACVVVRRPRPERVKRRRRHEESRCGSGVEIVVHDRRAAGAREAQAHVDAALQLAEKLLPAGMPGKDEAERQARWGELRQAVAQARMLRADAEYERFLRLRLPSEIDFGRAPEKARRLFQRWFTARMTQLEATRHLYEQVILEKQPHWVIAAAARVGQLFQDFAAQLVATPVPPAPPPPPGIRVAEWREEFHSRYCANIDERVGVLEDKAIEALGQCLKRSTQLSWYNEWSTMCEAELHQLRPGTFPLATEIRAEPSYMSLAMEPAPLALTLR